jgi:nitrite reductase/ring-hydroxylating ferredoxin subunit
MILEQKINAKKKLIGKHQNELAALYAQCTHEGYVEEKTRYFSGSYYDTAYTTYWNECKLCGAKSETTTKDHSWYG